MLHTQTLDPPTLELLKSLQTKPYLNGYYLVGGTALALYFGHRKSIDLDFFPNFGFDTQTLLEQIHQDYPYQILYTATNTLKGSINNIKVDIISHRYPYIGEPFILDGMALISVEDIIAMKLNAIATSGQRSKDFIDIYYAFQKFNLDEMLEFYKKKYQQANETHILKSLIFFDDVDLSDWPVLIQDTNLKWKDVIRKIELETLNFINNKI